MTKEEWMVADHGQEFDKYGVFNEDKSFQHYMQCGFSEEAAAMMTVAVAVGYIANEIKNK